MNKIEESWWSHFIPECYFDTVLLKKLMQTDKRLMHRKGCNNVVRDLDSERLQSSFAVAIVDKDKKELDYLKKCTVVYQENKIILWKHSERHQYVIQLDPPLEKWIVEILRENNLRIEDFGYLSDYKKLKKQIKDDIDSEVDVKLNKLVGSLIKTECSTIRNLRSILHHLRENNYQFDINELKNA